MPKSITTKDLGMQTIISEKTTFDKLSTGAYFLWLEDDEVKIKTGPTSWSYSTDQSNRREARQFVSKSPVVRLKVERQNPDETRFYRLPIGTAFVWYGETPEFWNASYKWSEDLFAPFPPPPGQLGGQSSPAAHGSISEIVKVPIENQSARVIILPRFEAIDGGKIDLKGLKNCHKCDGQGALRIEGEIQYCWTCRGIGKVPICPDCGGPLNGVHGFGPDTEFWCANQDCSPKLRIIDDDRLKDGFLSSEPKA